MQYIGLDDCIVAIFYVLYFMCLCCRSMYLVNKNKKQTVSIAHGSEKFKPLKIQAGLSGSVFRFAASWSDLSLGTSVQKRCIL